MIIWTVSKVAKALTLQQFSDLQNYNRRSLGSLELIIYVQWTMLVIVIYNITFVQNKIHNLDDDHIYFRVPIQIQIQQ